MPLRLISYGKPPILSEPNFIDLLGRDCALSFIPVCETIAVHHFDLK